MSRALLTLLLITFAAAAAAGGPVRHARVEAARVYFEFNTDLLRRMGAVVTVPEQAGKVADSELRVWEGRASDLEFAVRDGGFRSLVSGELVTASGLTLASHGDVIESRGLRVRALPGSLFFEVLTLDGFPLFRLLNTHAWLDPANGDLSFRHMDIQVTPKLADFIGHRRYTDITVGEAHMETVTTVPRAWLAEKGASCGVVAVDGDINVQLTGIGSVSERARDPGVRVAFAPDASLKNVGTADVPWFRAIDPDGGPRPPFGQHPYLVMAAYRITDGVLEQLGRSDAKHAFFTVNFGEGCQCPGGQVLHLNCQDIYGVSSNSDQHYLAPRGEITAHLGDWASEGSHFDTHPDKPKDDFRDHRRTDHTDPFAHRLVVAEDELLVEDAEYHVEAWYVIKDDVDISNSMGHRQMDPRLIGETWSFTPFLSDYSNGPAIDAWVGPEDPGSGALNEWVDSPSGHLKLAVRTTELGGGNYEYVYALMNLDYDRQVRSVEIPAPAGIDVSNIRFWDTDDDANNDWSGEREGDSVVWTAANPKRTALDWGMLYSFAFIASTAPEGGTATLTPLERPSGLKGEPAVLTPPTLAPSAPGLKRRTPRLTD